MAFFDFLIYFDSKYIFLNKQNYFICKSKVLLLSLFISIMYYDCTVIYNIIFIVYYNVVDYLLTIQVGGKHTSLINWEDCTNHNSFKNTC